MSSLSLKKFVGQVAVVTGASAGIGKAVAELLVKNGVIVAGLARRVDRLEDHSKQLINEKGKLHAFQCDLTNQQEILTTFKKITTNHGPISVLINNAGLSIETNIIGGDIEKWKPVLDTNILAVAICIREAVASMKQHNLKGHIINVNSMAGHSVYDFPNASVYPATKHAITALTETVRLEINREKLPIKITSLSPGYVATDFIERAFGKAIDERLKSRAGLESKDIAETVLYILSTPDHVNVKELTVCVQGEIF
ncbi:unnamed protein product [Ceutorhynchus assimilis]|uniref:Farnesol dehydrogenase-like n=1 Tax=Ceutorhynchus assimilis TaxID=467358 RepID=A0A9N9MHF6_9CUCU|nr:unnamed protein product [Ceutorhynchus assimilis]